MKPLGALALIGLPCGEDGENGGEEDDEGLAATETQVEQGTGAAGGNDALCDCGGAGGNRSSRNARTSRRGQRVKEAAARGPLAYSPSPSVVSSSTPVTAQEMS
jgi:hypothetical protein